MKPELALTPNRFRKLGAVRDFGWRCKDGGHPRPDSHANDRVPTLEMRTEFFWLCCWADFSQWWLVVLSPTAGGGVEVDIPRPATVGDLLALRRLLGMDLKPTETKKGKK